MIAVICGPEFHVHKVESSIGCSQEDNLQEDPEFVTKNCKSIVYLHNSVVQWHIVGKQI